MLRVLLAMVVLLSACSLAGAEMSSPAPATATASAQQRRFTGTVEIYVTDWCGYCKKALKYLERNGISHVAYNIEKDAAAKQRYQQLGGRGVPFIVIGSNKMSGFSEEALEHYLR